jgi:hypothetical protein
MFLGIPYYLWIALALVATALGFESSRTARARRECQAEGHLWTHEWLSGDRSLHCTRCGQVF